MGADYGTCAGCDFGYRDDSPYLSTCECGSVFHNSECGKLTNYGDWNNDTASNRIDDEIEITCKICRKEVGNDYVLLQALLKHFNLTKQDALEIYRSQKD